SCSSRPGWKRICRGTAAGHPLLASLQILDNLDVIARLYSEGTRYRVTYEFQTRSGTRQQSRCDIGKTPPAIRAIIPVVYHRDRPGWSATYPLNLVRPERLVS